MDLSPFFSFNNQGQTKQPALTIPNENSFYGRFRSIVKQRYFGIKLEEEPFMTFLEGKMVLI